MDLPETLYANILLALEREDIPLLFRFWRQSTGMGTSGQVIRTLITQKYPSFHETTDTYFYKELSETYKNNFDALLNFPWDRYFADLFVREFAKNFLIRERRFRVANSGKFALLLLRLSKKKEKLNIILPRILEVTYADYGFFEYDEEQEKHEEEGEDLAYFLENCKKKECRSLLESILYMRIGHQPETGCNIESILHYEKFTPKHWNILYALLKKEKYTATLLPILIDIRYYQYHDRYTTYLKKIDEVLTKDQKYRFCEYFYIDSYGLQYVEFSQLSKAMSYTICRALLARSMDKDKPDIRKILKKLEKQGFLFSAEGYRAVFCEDSFIREFESF